ncbi:MAG: hypothetical protein J6Y95_03545, partial [Lachnospiraceae bacterium]|nr:hypothetical protein [Lachnospiraceae bacterium]
MKKILAILLAAVFAFTMLACNKKPTEPTTEAPTTAAPTEKPTEAPTEAPTNAPTEAPGADVMSHADYIAAAVDDPVVLEMYVQDTQS